MTPAPPRKSRGAFLCPFHHLVLLLHKYAFIMNLYILDPECILNSVRWLKKVT